MKKAMNCHLIDFSEKAAAVEHNVAMDTNFEFKCPVHLRLVANFEQNRISSAIYNSFCSDAIQQICSLFFFFFLKAVVWKATVYTPWQNAGTENNYASLKKRQSEKRKFHFM